jgi:hypothetical protein
MTTRELISTLVASHGCRSRPCTSLRTNAGASFVFRSRVAFVLNVVVARTTLYSYNKVACV